ncbi:MAG TPA: pyridoxal phosphate-dependent aminotransferase [Rudaea sp.]|uniref:pyridoxal phosphate-dependent aminotransferase n=1 Tax=Rudaea sp. TaxID=2136325 RepID=UPI002F92F6C1
MDYQRMPIEIESPEQIGYAKIACNLTESSFRDARFADLNLDLRALVLSYGDHRGHPFLRAALAADYAVAANDVLLTVGAASALFIVATSLLERGERMLVLRPNYATNIETPRTLGAEIDFIDLKFDDGFRIDARRIAAMIRPDTKLVSITTPHNPTGVMLGESELRQLIEITRIRGCFLLVDETYRDMAYQSPPPLAASIAAHVISVASLSKTYGLPGLRLGWLVCRDSERMHTLLAAKEQIFICGSALDEEVAWQYFRRRENFLPAIRAAIVRHRDLTLDWLAREARLQVVQPAGGVVCFPRIRADARVDIETFYRVLNDKYATFVGPGHWFEQERALMRIGFGWPTTAELTQGLANISRALDEATR